MTDTNNQQFKIVAAITKHYIRKAADGTDKYILEGLASNTKIDLTGERMADSAIEAMAKSLETNTVSINNEHRDGWDDDFGEVTKLWVNDDHELMMEAELDPDHYRTQTLIKNLEKGKKLGLSIGGVVKEAAMEWFAELGRKVMTYKDISLFHVAVTSQPAVSDTWVTPITKSVKDWKEVSMPKDYELVDKNVDDDQAVETVEESQETEESENDTTAADATADAADEVVAETEAEETQAESATEDEAETEAIEKTDEVEETEEELTEESDTEADDESADAEQDDDTVTEADDAGAAGQEDDSAATEKSAPDQANAEEAQVEKAAIFDGWASANVAEISVRALTEELSWQVWRAVYTHEDDERTPEERKAYVAQALGEYSTIVQSVADALIDNGIDGDVAEVERSFVTPRADDIEKSINDHQEKAEHLTKSVSDKDEKLGQLQKSLEEKESELETTTKALEEAEGKLDILAKRKAYVVDRFGQLETLDHAQKSEGKESVADAWLKQMLG